MKIHHATAAKARKFHITLTVEENEVVATSKAGVRLASGLQGNKVLEDAITKQTGKPAKGTPEGKAAAKAAIGSMAKAIQERVAASKTKSVPVVDPYETLAKEEGWKKTRWGFSKEGEESVRVDSWRALCADQGLELEIEDDEDSDADQGKSIVKAKYKAKYRPTKDKCGDELAFQINEFITVEDDETGEKKVSKKLLRAFAEANGAWKPSYGSLASRTGGWNAGMSRMNVANIIRGKIRRAIKNGEKFEVVWPKV